MTTKPKTRTPIVQALARHKIAQAAVDAHFGMIDDVALANQLFDAERDALEVLAETPCSDAEFVEKLRYLLAHEARIVDGPQDGHQEFGYILVAVDRHFKSDSPFSGRRQGTGKMLKKSRWPMEERLCRQEGLSMVLSLYLRSTRGINSVALSKSHSSVSSRGRDRCGASGG